MVWNVIQILVRVEIVVLGGDVDVIYIKQDSAVSEFHDFT